MNREQTKTLLLVEDEVIIAMMEKQQLEKLGYVVSHVTNGEDAVQQALDKDMNYDLILMDIDLGSDIDGTQAAETILKEKDIPVVFLSSHIEPEIVEKTEKITSYGYVVKNSGIVVLDASIKMALKLFEAKSTQKLAEATIKAHELWLSETARIARVGGWKIDLNGNTLEWTDETFRIHELPIGNPPNVAEAIQFYHEEDRLRVSEAVQLAVENGEDFDFEARIITAKQNLKWVRAIGYTSFHEGRMVFVRGTVQDITDSKQTEIQLTESEEKYRTLVNSTLQGVVIAQSDPIRLVFANPAMAQISGYTPEKLIEMRPDELSKLIHEEDRQRFFSNFQKRIQGENIPQTNEYRLVTKDGIIKWVALYSSQIEFVNESATLTTFMDIRERKRAEEALNETKRLLSESQQLGKVGGWELNIDTLEQKWTEETFRIHEVDLTYDNTVEKGINFYTPDSKPIIENAVKRAIECHEPYDLDLKIITAKGNLRHVHTIGKIDLANRRLFGFFQDITGRKLAEEALQESASRFRSLFENSPIAYQSLNEVGQYIDVNPRLCQLLGYSRDELLGKGFGEFWSKRTQHRFPETFEGFKCSGAATGELELVRKDGSLLTVVLEGKTQRDHNGDFVRTHCILHNISERKQAEEEIQQQLSEKETLLKEVHHRIKNNIASIEALLSMQADSSDNADVKSALQESIARIQSIRVLYQYFGQFF